MISSRFITVSSIAILVLGQSLIAATTITFSKASAKKATLDLGGEKWEIDTVSYSGADTAQTSVTYTIDNLDFDGDGAADPFSTTLNVAASNTQLPVEDPDPSKVNVFSTTGSYGVHTGLNVPLTNGNKLNVLGEQLTFSLASLSVNLSGGGTDDTIVFETFSNVRFDNYGANARHLVTTTPNSVDPTNGNANSSDKVVFDIMQLISEFSVSYTEETGVTPDSYRIKDVKFSFTTDADVTVISGIAPEPSTAMLSLIGLTCLLGFRRR